MAVLAGQVQRRGTLVGASVDGGAVADQQADQQRMTMQGSDVEGRETVHVRAVNPQDPSLQGTHLETHTHTQSVQAAAMLHMLRLLPPSGLGSSWGTGREGGRAEAAAHLHPPPHLSIPEGSAPTHTRSIRGGQV